MTAEGHERLADELTSLGRTIVVDPPPPELAERVLARIDAGAPAVRSRSGWRRRLHALTGRSRRRLVAVVIAAVLVALALTPPVRAQLVEWLRIGGVIIRTAPAPTTSGVPGPPPPGRSVTLADARRLVGFEIGVPTALGAPDRVTVSDDRRVVGMDWGTGVDRVHLDQFDGRLSWVFIKESWSELVPVQVGGNDGVWFPGPHRIVYVDSDGVEHRAEARLAGPTVVWEQVTTLRLEGIRDRAEAVRVAESVR